MPRENSSLVSRIQESMHRPFALSDTFSHLQTGSDVITSSLKITYVYAVNTHKHNITPLGMSTYTFERGVS